MIYFSQANDHADWADAKLTRASALSAPAGAVYLSDMEWLSSTNGWGPAERDMANGGKSSGDGKPLSINGLGFSKGIGAHAESSIEIDLNGAYQTFSSYIGVDDAAPHHLSSVDFYVYGDDILLYQSEQLTGADNALLINVDVSGVDILRLEIGFSNGDGTSDGADWALAHLIPAGITAPVGEPTNPFGYRGEYTDFESGLIYLRNRYYDPSIGRFITEDPAKDGVNWYSYCANNPVMFVDPTGYAKEGDERFSQSVRDEIAIYGQIWSDAEVAYSLGIISVYEKKAVQHNAERKADDIRYRADHPYKTFFASAVEFAVFDVALGDINNGTVYAADLSGPALEKMYGNQEHLRAIVNTLPITVAATVDASSRGRNLFNTKINGKMTRVDIEFPQGGKPANLHIQIKGTGQKFMIESLDDLNKLPKAVSKNTAIINTVKKGLKMLGKLF